MAKRALIVTAVAGGLALGACGGGDGYGSSGGTSASTGRYGGAGASSTSRSTTSSTPATATVEVGVSALGPVLTDAQGMTLYLYTGDQGTTSAVPAGVLAAWPPLRAEGAPGVGSGLDAAELSTARQPNGETWVAYNDHLLYRFTGDRAPGDVTGQGLGGVWFAVSPDGEQVSS